MHRGSFSGAVIALKHHVDHLLRYKGACTGAVDEEEMAAAILAESIRCTLCRRAVKHL